MKRSAVNEVAPNGTENLPPTLAKNNGKSKVPNESLDLGVILGQPAIHARWQF